MAYPDKLKKYQKEKFESYKKINNLKINDNEAYIEIKVKDYTYIVKNNNLIVYFILQIDGIIDDLQNNKSNNKSILEEINELNEINEDISMIRENQTEDLSKVEEAKIVEEIIEVNKDCINIVENKKMAVINNNWSNDLFKLNDSYAVFHKFKLK